MPRTLGATSSSCSTSARRSAPCRGATRGSKAARAAPWRSRRRRGCRSCWERRQGDPRRINLGVDKCLKSDALNGVIIKKDRVCAVAAVVPTGYGSNEPIKPSITRPWGSIGIGIGKCRTRRILPNHIANRCNSAKMGKCRRRTWLAPIAYPANLACLRKRCFVRRKAVVLLIVPFLKITFLPFGFRGFNLKKSEIAQQLVTIFRCHPKGDPILLQK